MRIIVLSIIGLCFIPGIAFSEPTVTTGGSVEAIGTYNSKGQSSFTSQVDLSLDIDLTDNITGVVQLRDTQSTGISSINLHQGYISMGRIMNTGLSGYYRDNYPLQPHYVLDKNIGLKIFTLPVPMNQTDAGLGLSLDQRIQETRLFSKVGFTDSLPVIIRQELLDIFPKIKNREEVILSRSL